MDYFEMAEQLQTYEFSKCQKCGHFQRYDPKILLMRCPECHSALWYKLIKPEKEPHPFDRGMVGDNEC